jgi:hypothetical protein
MNFLKFNQKMNLEIGKRTNSAWAEFGPRLGTAGLAQRPKWPGWPVAPTRGADARHVVTAPVSGKVRAARRRRQAMLGRQALSE